MISYHIILYYIWDTKLVRDGTKSWGYSQGSPWGSEQAPSWIVGVRFPGYWAKEWLSLSPTRGVGQLAPQVIAGSPGAPGPWRWILVGSLCQVHTFGSFHRSGPRQRKKIQEKWPVNTSNNGSAHSRPIPYPFFYFTQRGTALVFSSWQIVRYVHSYFHFTDEEPMAAKAWVMWPGPKAHEFRIAAPTQVS